MTLADLNAKIDALPMQKTQLVEWPPLDRFEARYRRDERLGILGVHAGMVPTEEQVGIVHDELFPMED